ncbi:2-hydroxyacid dehydrogenase [soil metagenome]
MSQENKKNPQVLLIDTLHPSFISILEAAGCTCIPGYNWRIEEILTKINQYDGLAIRSRFKLDQHFLERASTIKCIGRAGAGMENIDVDFAQSVGITCVHAPEGNRDAVGEHAIGMLLSLMNHLIRADQEVRSGIWRREENRGLELQGKTVGIIGFGNMGSAFAKKLQGFECTILAYDKYIRLDHQKYPFVKQCEQKEIFDQADIVSLHLPLTEETRYLVNEDYLESFKKPIFIINTARGKIVDTAALVNALKANKIRGAALDVLEYESISFEQLNATQLPEPFQYLIKSDKVILSPHIGGWTHESNEKIAQVLAEKMLQVFNH